MCIKELIIKLDSLNVKKEKVWDNGHVPRKDLSLFLV